MAQTPYAVGDVVACNARYGNDRCYVRVSGITNSRRVLVQVLETTFVDRSPNLYETTYQVTQPLVHTDLRYATLSKEHGWSFLEEPGDTSSRMILETECMSVPLPNPLTFTITSYD